MISEAEQIANLADRYVALAHDLEDIKSDLQGDDRAFFERPSWSLMSLIVESHTRYATMWEERYTIYKEIGLLTKDIRKVTDAIFNAQARNGTASKERIDGKSND